MTYTKIGTKTDYNGRTDYQDNNTGAVVWLTERESIDYAKPFYEDIGTFERTPTLAESITLRAVAWSLSLPVVIFYMVVWYG